ncbi:MAG: hypothetical protein AAF789_02650 [Bacteroidota bacterium]
MNKYLKQLLSLTMILLFAASCTQEEIEILNDRDISINNNQEELSQRMTKTNDPIEIIGESRGRTNSSIKLTLRGQLAPPVVDGNILQATSIARRSSFFAVSYNFKGETYAGGIDLINDELELRSQMLFSDSDINDIGFNGNDLYFAGGTSSMNETAFVERISMNPSRGVLTLQNQVRTGLGSFSANSVMHFRGSIYVTTGNDDRNGGGLYKLSRSLEEQDYSRIKDARWVTGWENSVVTASGTPDRIRIYETDGLNRTREFEHNGVNEPEGKMTIDVDRNLVFVAGGTQGLLVYDIDGNFIAKHAFGNGAVTNAVAADGGKLFISNGEGGVHIATYDPFLEVIGKLDLPQDQSVNHIVFFDNFLYVASGTGGVKMIEVE